MAFNQNAAFFLIGRKPPRPRPARSPTPGPPRPPPAPHPRAPRSAPRPRHHPCLLIRYYGGRTFIRVPFAKLWLGCRQIRAAKSKLLPFIRIRDRFGFLFIQQISAKLRPGFQAHAPRYTAAGIDALKGIKISPDPAKAAAVNKINSILREAHPPKQPEQ